MAIKRSHNSTPAAEENLLTPNPTIEETEKAEAQIRPQSLEDYIGQQDLKANLKVTIAAAKARQEAIDHLLFYGPPGLGKTTMALILAAEMGVNCRITAAPALERPRDITGILINLQPRDILFIDEIHRLNRVAAKIRSISLPPFTLIGATTKVGSLTSPLRDRFGMIQRLRFYTVEELTTIILRSATIFNIPMTEAGAIEIARRGRGTPRIANRLLKRVRDYVQVKGETMITPQLAAEGLNQLNVDSMGLDWTDRLVLKTMIEQFQGRPVGLEAVAAATGEDAKTIEEVYEPYLLQIGYLNRTARGRVVTAAAYEHLGLLAKLPKKNDRSLPLFEL